MTLKQYLIIMGLATALSLASLVVVLVNIDPWQSGVIGHLFFYVTAFSTVLGASSLFIFGLYHWFSHRLLPMYRYVECSFRDALVVAILVVGLLYLQALRFLHWWNVGLVFVLGLSAMLWLVLRQQEENKRFM